MKVRESDMPDRDYWESLIDHCGLLEEMKLSDSRSVFEFGTGYGSFLRCFARRGTRLGGVDIEARMVEATRNRIARLGGTGQIVLGDFFEPGLLAPLGKFDTCLLMNILHHERPETLIELARSMLAPGGRIGICHWRDDIDTPRGPPRSMRIGLEHARALVTDAGLAVSAAANSRSCPYHYFVVATSRAEDCR